MLHTAKMLTAFTGLSQDVIEQLIANPSTSQSHSLSQAQSHAVDVMAFFTPFSVEQITEVVSASDHQTQQKVDLAHVKQVLKHFTSVSEAEIEKLVTTETDGQTSELSVGEQLAHAEQLLTHFFDAEPSTVERFLEENATPSEDSRRLQQKPVLQQDITFDDEPMPDISFDTPMEEEPAIEVMPISIDQPDEDYYYGMDDPYYCDPYYEYCGGPSYDYSYMLYTKRALYGLSGVSLFQFLAPIAIFTELEQKAYLDHFGSEKTSSSAETTVHYTDEVSAWETIMYMSSAIYGTMLFFGMFSMSGVMKWTAALYIEHGLSNAYIFAYLYGAWLLLEVALNSSNKLQDGTAFAAYSIVSLITFGFQNGMGTEAMYYLTNSGLDHADHKLWPSIFYGLKWLEHTPRQQDNNEHDPYYGPYY